MAFITFDPENGAGCEVFTLEDVSVEEFAAVMTDFNRLSRLEHDLMVTNQGKADFQQLALNRLNEIERLSKIEVAARNLVAVKGRFHTEQAFNALVEAVK